VRRATSIRLRSCVRCCRERSTVHYQNGTQSRRCSAALAPASVLTGWAGFFASESLEDVRAQEEQAELRRDAEELRCGLPLSRCMWPRVYQAQQVYAHVVRRRDRLQRLVRAVLVSFVRRSATL
jgi:hypothetical protein